MAPIATGIKTKLNPFAPKIAMIGLAPAGGWILLVIIITHTASATAKPIENIEKLLVFDEIDGVMIGPYDISGSLGVPGKTTHQLVIEATHKVIDACEKFGKSCGTQIERPTVENVKAIFDLVYTFGILGSDLFILSAWVKKVQELLTSNK